MKGVPYRHPQFKNQAQIRQFARALEMMRDVEKIGKKLIAYDRSDSDLHPENDIVTLSRMSPINERASFTGYLHAAREEDERVLTTFDVVDEGQPQEMTTYRFRREPEQLVYQIDRVNPENGQAFRREVKHNLKADTLDFREWRTTDEADIVVEDESVLFGDFRVPIQH